MLGKNGRRVGYAVGFLFIALGIVVSLQASDPERNIASAGQTDWEKSLDPNLRGKPAFEFVVEDPKLPRVLLIGDSISIGYTPETRQLLKGKANVLRIPTNGGATTKGTASIDPWLGSGKWDVIHFNWGLHDIKRMKDGRMHDAGEMQVSPDQYEKNLNTLVERLKRTGARLIWASTTPVPEGATGRIKGDDVKANTIAEKVMKQQGVVINDLYAAVLPNLAQYQQPKNVHFNNDGSAFLAKQVATKITEALAATK